MEEVEKEIMPIGLQKWKEEDPIMVSVLTAAYNHEKFIEQALKGFLMQRTNFRVELIVNDDASTDGTAEVIKRYEHQYPNLFVTFYQEENQYSKGKKPFSTFLYPAAKGKYVAICEGDDYWLDESKLQKQVDYLEQHKEAVLCFHKAKVIDEAGKEIHGKELSRKSNKVRYQTEDLFKSWFIPTASVVFRNRILKTFPQWFLTIKNGDISLYFLLSEFGSMDCLDGKMSVYRKHSDGVSSSVTSLEQFVNLVVIYNNIRLESDRNLDKEVTKAIETKFAYLLNKCIINNKSNLELFIESFDIRTLLKLILYKLKSKLSWK
ncbi:MAG: glycosyltransferase [Cyclobacteriaceae bacterium]